MTACYCPASAVKIIKNGTYAGQEQAVYIYEKN